MQNNSSAIIERLKAMESASRTLQEAIMKRNADAVLAATGRLERIVADFSAEQRQGNGPTVADDGDERRQIFELATNIQRIQRTSRKLAVAFMEVINKTLASLNPQNAAENVLYQATGRMVSSSAAPILVQQKG